MDASRRPHETVRALHLVLNVVGNCHSSACVEVGRTRVIAVVRPPKQLVQEYRGNRGRVSCMVHRAPTGAEAATAGVSGRTDANASAERDLALALEGVAEQIVVLESIPQLLLEVVLEIVSDDGGLWDAASTAMSAALAAGGFDMYGLFTACSAGLLADGSVAVDLTSAEERNVDVSLTLCMNLGTGAVLYLAQRGSCELATLQQLLEAAQCGVLARRESILGQLK